MVDPNWNLLQGGNSLNYFGAGMQLGQQAAAANRANKLDNALAAYVTNPEDQGAFQTVARYDPKMAIGLQQQAAERKAAEAKQQQEKALTVARLFDGVTDEQTYQRNLNVARRMGIDVTGAPPNFDPNWVAENGAIMRLVAEKPEALSTFGKEAVDEGFVPGTPPFNARVKEKALTANRKIITPQQGAGAFLFDPATGGAQVLVQPNEGQGPMGAPAPSPGQSPAPQKLAPGVVVDGYRYKGGNPNDKANWEKAGGASSNAGGNFPGQ